MHNAFKFATVPDLVLNVTRFRRDRILTSVFFGDPSLRYSSKLGVTFRRVRGEQVKLVDKKKEMPTGSGSRFVRCIGAAICPFKGWLSGGFGRLRVNAHTLPVF